MKSQASVLQDENTYGEVFDNQYIDTNQDMPNPETSVEPALDSDLGEGRYIPFPYQKIYTNGVKQKQVGWWIGRVERVCEDYFTAVLEDMKGVVSVAEFDKEELTPSDQKLLLPHTMFSYAVTQVDKRSGREYVSKLSISGPAIWTERDAKKAKEYCEMVFPEGLLDF